ncbi:iron chaperone [Leptospira terpstrae]|uniref:iron chaperone n=1 Tax=Leptospira terpstrae TaxID=293075 RepID=UPI003CFC0947
MNSKIPKSIDEYIKNFPNEVQQILQTIRSTIQKEVPEATETISYAMPTFVLNGTLVHFAAYAKHIGFYALPSGNIAFQKEISKYKFGKGSIQFPLNEPIPYGLIKKIVKFRVNENLEKTKKRIQKKKSKSNHE